MEYEKPFLYIDTNFSPDDALMLKMAFNTFNFEIVGVSSNISHMKSETASKNIVAMSAKEELFLSIAAGEDSNMDLEMIEPRGSDEEIFVTNADYIEQKEAFDNLYEIADDCGKLEILTTGPLTNIAKAIEKYPDIIDYISHIFMLGGSLSGDFEYNFKSDAKAADIILNSGINVFILPDELANSVYLRDDLLNELYGNDEIINRILDEFKKIEEDERTLKAPLLLYLLEYPHAFIFEESGFKVDTKEDKGKLLRVNTRSKNYIVNKVNENTFYDYLKGKLS